MAMCRSLRCNSESIQRSAVSKAVDCTPLCATACRLSTMSVRAEQRAAHKLVSIMMPCFVLHRVSCWQMGLTKLQIACAGNNPQPLLLPATADQAAGPACAQSDALDPPCSTTAYGRQRWHCPCTLRTCKQQESPDSFALELLCSFSWLDYGPITSFQHTIVVLSHDVHADALVQRPSTGSRMHLLRYKAEDRLIEEATSMHSARTTTRRKSHRGR